MKIEQKVKCYGEYKVELRRRGEIIRTVENTNTFTNEGYKLFYGGETSIGSQTLSMLLGEGTTEITQSDSSLGNQISDTTITNNTVTYDVEVDGKPYTKFVITKNYSEGAIEGNISEIGLKAGSRFLCGQLLRDDNNQPTTIPVTSEDQLFVTYTVFFQQYEADVIYQDTIDGTEVTFEVLAHVAATRASSTTLTGNVNPVYNYRIGSGSKSRPSETITNYAGRIERNIGISISAGSSDQTIETITFDSYNNSHMRGDTYRLSFNPPLVKDKDYRFDLNFNLITTWDE